MQIATSTTGSWMTHIFSIGSTTTSGQRRAFVLGFLVCWLLGQFQHNGAISSIPKDYYLNSIRYDDSTVEQQQQVETTNCQYENSSKRSQQQQQREPYSYKGSFLEDYIWNHVSDLGLDKKLASGCRIWKEENASTPQVFKALDNYRTSSLLKYKRAVEHFTYLRDHNITDIRKHLHEGICDQLDLNLSSLFDDDGTTSSSVLSYSSRAGYMEPMLIPMRHPQYCFFKWRTLFEVSYIVHDFAHFCRQLQPTSRIVIMDLGASPQFGGGVSPWYTISEQYRQFGFHVDHVYAYEVTPFQAKDIYNGQLVPRQSLPAYHWINAGVSTTPGDPLHPWTMLEQEFDEDDFIIVKLDIDTPDLELPLAYQLVNSTRLTNLIDVLYFEHHVSMDEIAFAWGKSMRGTLQDSLKLFLDLRQQGIASHSWV